MTTTTLPRCQHVVRGHGQRQDLQCSRPVHGKEQRHLTTTALGWTGRYAHLVNGHGRAGGHPLPTVTLVGRRTTDEG